MSTRRLALCLVFAVVIANGAGAVPGAGEETPFNPHTREGCLHCHKGGPASLGPDRTVIFPSREEPHAAVASSCRSCHQEERLDFWLVIPRAAGVRPGTGATTGTGEPSVAGAPPAAAHPSTRPPATAAPAPAVTEGFENSHDSMDCASCHDKPADQIKQGSAAPPRFTTLGVDTFCRSCHSGVDRSHYPRGNLPLSGMNCLHCHRVHGRALLFPALRDDFPNVLAESVQLNPHGGKIFCLACHPDTPQAGAPVAFRFPGNALRLCQRCHSGVEHHPLKLKSTPATWKMDFARFPLEAEAITCVTCHKPLECLGVGGRENPRFLRGGPYNGLDEFCARCHGEKKSWTLNPHDQIDENGEVHEKKCLYCHVTLPNTNASGAGLRYTDTLTKLCASCHQVGAHPQADHLRPMPKVMLKQLQAYEERRQVRLPLDEENVTCVTCHNPHERGLLKGPAGVGADEEKRLRLTTYNEQCSPCHERH